MAPSVSKSRTQRSCDVCKLRKIKCSGEKSGCWHCTALNVECHYSERKRDAERRAYDSACRQIDFYEKFIEKICNAFMISKEDLLQLVNHSVDEHANTYVGGEQSPITISSNPTPTSPEETWQRRDSTFSFSVMSHDEQMATTSAESFRTAKSEQHSVDQESLISQSTNTTTPDTNVIDLETFNWNEEYNSGVSQPSSQDSHLFVPSFTNTLLKVYVTRIHSTFPVLDVSELLNGYRFYLRNTSVYPGQQWTIIFNYVFAIAVLHLKMQQGKSFPVCHTVYASRAYRLLHTESEQSAPELCKVQASMLAIFYFLASDQIQQAREKFLHTIREIKVLVSLPDSLMVINQRLRPLLSHLASLMSPILGEDMGICSPNRLHFKECVRITPAGAPTDAPATMQTNIMQSTGLIDESTPPHSNYSYLAQLHIINSISEQAITQLYAPSSPSQRSNSCDLLLQKTDDWRQKLPENLRFIDFHFQQSPSSLFPKSNRPQAMNLVYSYYSTKILITWPALLRSYHSNEKDESEQKVVNECVQAALQIFMSLPDPDDADSIRDACPVWCILHYVVQATAVVTSELQYRLYAKGSVEFNALITAASTSLRFLEKWPSSNPVTSQQRELAKSVLQDLCTINCSTDGPYV